MHTALKYLIWEHLKRFLRRFIHISVFFIYFITSCFVIGANQWGDGKNGEGSPLTDWLFSSMTVSLDQYPDDNNELPFLVKDPSEDGSVVLHYYPGFINMEYLSCLSSFHTEEKIKDPFRYIFSPPPQIQDLN